MSDWNYVPDRNLKKNNSPKIIETRFGDGYSQRMQNGINNFSNVWAVEYVNRTWTDIGTMETLLLGWGGVTAFTWTPPGEDEVKVICRNWDITSIVRSATDDDSYGSLSATFERVYE